MRKRKKIITVIKVPEQYSELQAKKSALGKKRIHVNIVHVKIEIIRTRTAYLP